MRADFCLGDWIIRPRRGCIERGEEVVHVHPKPMAVLECLADANGEVVTRDDLYETVWLGVIVTDDALTQCVAELRKAFGDSAKDSQIIKTIPKAGFCLVPPIETLVDRENIQAIRARKRLLGFSAIIVLLAVIAIWRMAEMNEVGSPVTAPQQPSVAVLPFANRSANPDDAFFVDGMHDDLVTHISKIGAIKTISRTSVMQYRKSNKSIPEIAAELGVTTVLEGSVQRAGDQVRINVQLIDARSDEHLWAEMYERQLSAANVFAIQSEIAEAIAETLRMTLSPREQQRIRSVPTDSLAAYEAYLIGKQRLAKRTSENLAEAEEYFRQAVELDPRYALAWVGLADGYVLQVFYSGLPKRETFDKAKAAIDMALELDRDLGEAYASLGLLKKNMKDLEGAEQAFKQALELSPNYAPGHRWFSMLLADLGRWEERLVRMETAVELDPLSTVTRWNYAISLREVGRVEEGLEQLEIVLEINPKSSRAHESIATIQWQVFNRLDMAAQGLV
ncbi:MAG: winged helix-turn-helix domain-containing protein, partial [Deltaproteobacteria bacterium]|nr:winged helix-turn-helix domain-containing protein [Deltaproteobacteria bacterium]